MTTDCKIHTHLIKDSQTVLVGVLLKKDGREMIVFKEKRELLF
jgi:hypothetical protein